MLCVVCGLCVVVLCCLLFGVRCVLCVCCSYLIDGCSFVPGCQWVVVVCLLFVDCDRASFVVG